MITPWNSYRNKLESLILIHQILKIENKKINLKKINKNDSSKPILVVSAIQRGEPNFSKHKKVKSYGDTIIPKEAWKFDTLIITTTEFNKFG
jgi:hypothetical protein